MKIYIASPSKLFSSFFQALIEHSLVNLPCMAFVTPRYLSPVSMVSAKDAWDYDPPLGALTHGKKELKKNLIF